jgi:hypothetical protein
VKDVLVKEKWMIVGTGMFGTNVDVSLFKETCLFGHGSLTTTTRSTVALGNQPMNDIPLRCIFVILKVVFFGKQFLSTARQTYCLIHLHR